QAPPRLGGRETVRQVLEVTGHPARLPPEVEVGRAQELHAGPKLAPAVSAGREMFGIVPGGGGRCRWELGSGRARCGGALPTLSCARAYPAVLGPTRLPPSAPRQVCRPSRPRPGDRLRSPTAGR